MKRAKFLPKVLRLLALFAIAGVQTSCKRLDPAEQQFETLFEGYQLLAIDSYPADLPLEDLKRWTDDNAISRVKQTFADRSLAPGRIYIFDKSTKASNYDLGVKVIPRRLQRIGARLTQPPSVVDLMIGGSFFAIEFELDGNRGMLFNELIGKTRDCLVFAYVRAQ